MKTLKDFESVLNKCSKCGQCQIACPVYKFTKNECSLSKGLFIMLYGVTKGELSLSGTLNKYIDGCLKCGKCNDFCPSGIDVVEILTAAKYEYLKNKISFKIIKFFQSRLIFSNIIKFFSLLFNPIHKDNKKNISSSKFLYFKGCVNQMFPNTDKYLKKIFSDIDIISPEFDCCGLPFLSEGNVERFEKSAKFNMSLIPQNCSYIVTDCASCESTLKFYKKYFVDSLLDGLEFINWGELIASKNIKFKFNKKIKVTFHKPCHLKNDEFINVIMNNCENVSYVEMDEYDECCGFAGSFPLKNPKLSLSLLRNKVLNIVSLNPDFVITTCPSCLAGLKFGLKMFSKNNKIKAVSLLEFLNLAQSIEHGENI